MMRCPGFEPLCKHDLLYFTTSARAMPLSKMVLCAVMIRSARGAEQETERFDGGGATFLRDRWERPGSASSGGYGITCVLEGGALLEKVSNQP